ncbi:14309_t:CDS:1, partial [Funneliformis geosporum]
DRELCLPICSLKIDFYLDPFQLNILQSEYLSEYLITQPH